MVHVSEIQHMLPETQNVGEDNIIDLFDVIYKTNDGVNHDLLTILTHRFSPHNVNGENVLIVSFLETVDETIGNFFKKYVKETFQIQFVRYDVYGNVTEQKDYTGCLEDCTVPFDSVRTSRSVLVKEFLFHEGTLIP